MIARKMLFPSDALPMHAPHRWACREVFARVGVSILCTDTEFVRAAGIAGVSDEDFRTAREAIDADPCDTLWVGVNV